MTYYGVDLYGRPRLADLLRELNQIDEFRWIRILYNYPNYFTNELYEALASCEKVIPYLDMPLQHINDRMLKMMNRRHTRAETEEIIGRLRETMPGLVLRTTFIVGFPGETEDEFEELLDYVKETRFERLGVFPYSLESDTPAAKIPGHLPDEVKNERRDRVMAAQQPIAFAFNASLVGKTLDVLIDGPAPSDLGPGVWAGRSYADAPDVDGLVFVRDRGLRAGDLVPCEILSTEGYDLIARPVEGASPKRKVRARPKAKSLSSSSPFTILPG
jgi:ribosomal protein S12 methylthiotransferase